MALVVLDASVLIAFHESNDAHHDSARAAVAASAGDDLILPATAYAEVLVWPLRRTPARGADVDETLDDLGVYVAPLTREIARAAAALRARRPSLRLPDAAVIATGEVLDAARVLTADASWRRVSRRVAVI